MGSSALSTRCGHCMLPRARRLRDDRLVLHVRRRAGCDSPRQTVQSTADRTRRSSRCGIGNERWGVGGRLRRAGRRGLRRIQQLSGQESSTAEQVAEEYSTAKGALPDTPTLVSYTSTLTPGGVIPAVRSSTLASRLTVVPSKDSAPVLIEDEWALYDAKGEKWWGPVRKPFNEADHQAGAFVGGFGFTVPDELPQGNYEFRNRVFLNGVEVQTNSNPIQVAALDVGIAGGCSSCKKLSKRPESFGSPIFSDRVSSVSKQAANSMSQLWDLPSGKWQSSPSGERNSFARADLPRHMTR